MSNLHHSNKKPLVLCILDGYGFGDGGPYDAVAAARTPVLDGLFAAFPHSRLACSGLDVGLPRGQMGNSEVGHTNIGAGRVVYQDLTRISKAVEDGDFFQNPVLLDAISHAKAAGGRVHLMGLVSDGGVHSHMQHIFALLELCAAHNAETRLHCFLDGRDTPPQSGAGFVAQVRDKIDSLGGDISIATIMGRYYAMDRDMRWERVEKAYAAMALGEASLAADPVQAVEASYAAGVTDEFMLPVRFGGSRVQSRDCVIFFNFRPDRAREITRAFTDPGFDGFPREGGLIAPHYVCMTQYDAGMPGVAVAFEPQSLDNTLGEYISRMGLTQLRIAETEKYAHVTFFFNGGQENSFPGEERILIPSPKVATYDLKPEMSAFEVADKCAEAIESGRFDVVILNLANCDMVGHTGDFDAAVAAVKAVDKCVGTVRTAVDKADGTLIVTADHGNAELMFSNGAPHTAHTENPVPFIVCRKGVTVEDGALCDIAPTMLDILGLKKPAGMTGRSLIQRLI